MMEDLVDASRQQRSIAVLSLRGDVRTPDSLVKVQVEDSID